MAASRARRASTVTRRSSSTSSTRATRPATSAAKSSRSTAASPAPRKPGAAGASKKAAIVKKPVPHALRPAPKRPAALFDRLEVTSIHVTNMERAVAFYRDALGLRAAQIWPNWAEFPLKGGVLLGVHLESDCGAGGRRSGGATGLYFPVEGIKKVVTQLRKRGVKITGEVTRHSYGTVAYFADPDGNEFGLIDGGL